MTNGNKRVRKRKITKQGDNLATEVRVKYDPSVIRKDAYVGDTRTPEQIRLDKEYEQQRQKDAIGGSRLANMGFESSMGKDQRKFQLQSLITKKEVVTLQSAIKALGLAKSTVTTYVRELGYQMYDTETGKFVGAKEGKRVGIDEV